MAKQSGMKVTDMPMSKKLEYEDFMNCRRSFVEFDNVKYTLKNSSVIFTNQTQKLKEPLLL